MIARCNICKDFSVPWDEIGKAIMAEHLRTEHSDVKPISAIGIGKREAANRGGDRMDTWADVG